MFVFMFVFIFAWPRLWVYDGISDGRWGGIPVVSGIGEDLHRRRLIAINLSGDRGWARSPGCQKTERSRKSNYLFSSLHDFPSIEIWVPSWQIRYIGIQLGVRFKPHPQLIFLHEMAILVPAYPANGRLLLFADTQ